MTGAQQSPEWMLDGLCREADGDAWFPEKGSRANDAIAICQDCSVRALCLEYALAHDERWGVWGGLSERERSAIRRPNLCARCLQAPAPGMYRHCAPCRREARLETFARYQGKAA